MQFCCKVKFLGVIELIEVRHWILTSKIKKSLYSQFLILLLFDKFLTVDT